MSTFLSFFLPFQERQGRQLLYIQQRGRLPYRESRKKQRKAGLLHSSSYSIIQDIVLLALKPTEVGVGWGRATNDDAVKRICLFRAGWVELGIV